MKEIQFVESREKEWAAWDLWLKESAGKNKTFTSIAIDELPGSFRRLNRDLALARSRQYSAGLVEALQRRVLSAHQRIYGALPAHRDSLFYFVTNGFPRLVRREWRFVLASSLLFFAPLLLMLFIVQRQPESAYLLLSPEQLYQMQEMYSPLSEHVGRERSASSQWQMWGFYIANNVKIGFQCFASGIAFGVGAVFYLLYNGLFIGATAGHLTQLGYIETFWGFVSGHSAFELIGIMLSGAAGLRIGYALIAPGRKTRKESLKEAAHTIGPLLAGAATLIFMAAFIEAFWSPLAHIPATTKYLVGVSLWVLTGVYFLFAGKARRAT